MYSALIFADIDHFKRINDTHGHIVGDKILAYVAGIIRASLDKDACVTRIGGEEFAVALGNTTEEEASSSAETIRSAVEAQKFINNKSGMNYGPVTVLLG